MYERKRTKGADPYMHLCARASTRAKLFTKKKILQTQYLYLYTHIHAHLHLPRIHAGVYSAEYALFHIIHIRGAGRCSVLQCVAVAACCSALLLQRVAVRCCCSVLQCVAVAACCSALLQSVRKHNT